MTMDKHAMSLLQPVIVCARSVLADMEVDDIPAALRRVARSSARTLPPPFSRSLLRELASNDSFRGDVTKRYEEGETIDEDMLAFLRDPEAGMARIEELVDISRDIEHDVDLATARDQIAALNDQLAESKRRFSALGSQHEKDLAEARSSVADGHLRAQARIRELDRMIGADRSEMDGMVEQICTLTEELAEMDGRLVASAERVRKRDGPMSRVSPRRADETPSDPLELARWLDKVERRVRSFRDTHPVGVAGSAREPMTISRGIAPDSREALESLIAQGPARFILDGYNIGGEIDASNFSTRSARDEVIDRAGRLARGTDAEVLVVFDGPDDDERSGFMSSEGVSVRFSRGVKADDVIAGLVEADPDRVVVITNDRDLRGRCAADGCVPIWSTAFLNWL